jgi:hypothetical protein
MPTAAAQILKQIQSVMGELARRLQIATMLAAS